MRISDWSSDVCSSDLATIGVPAFADEERDYLEIAVIGCAFRAGAKGTRLTELIHRPIPYPVFLITSDEGGLTLSAAHKPTAQNAARRLAAEGGGAPARLPPGGRGGGWADRRGGK